MADNFVGEIRVFPFNFAPTGWALCNGQLMPISQNTALFSLLGTQFGGNGTTNFALPNLQGFIPVGQGQGPGLSDYIIGESGGAPTVALSLSTIPSHNHTLPVSAAAGRVNTPSPSTVLGATGRGSPDVYAGSATGSMLASSVGNAGGGQPHNNLMPYLVLNYCIALSGIFPSRS
jgi:microcystin-dependent protein